MITGDQVRAKNLLGWSQIGLALETGVDQTTVVNFETGRKLPSVLTPSLIKHCFEAAGVEFPEGEPVRLKAKARTIPLDKLNTSNDE